MYPAKCCVMPGAAFDVPEPEVALGSYLNRGRASGIEVVFTARAIYQRSEGQTIRIPYEEIVRTESQVVDKSEIASVTLVLRSGEKETVWIDGGSPARDALQLHQFLLNLFSARLRRATF